MKKVRKEPKKKGMKQRDEVEEDARFGEEPEEKRRNREEEAEERE